MKNLNAYKIQKRKDGRWTIKVCHRGQVYQIYGRTQQEVRRKLADRLKLIQEAKAYQLDNLSLSSTHLKDWAKCCLETYSKSYVSGNTYASYLCIMNNHLLSLGDKRLGEITNIMIQKHLMSLTKKGSDEPLSPKMLLNIRNFLSLIFNYAIQNRILLRNPVEGVQLPKGTVRKPRALTVEEQIALIKAVRQYKHPIMFSAILTLYTGLRKGEVLGLQWKDVDFAKKRLTIDKQLSRHYNISENGKSKSILETTAPKTETSVRYVYLIDELLDELKEYKETMLQWKIKKGYTHLESDFLFCSSKNTAIEPRRFYDHYTKVLKIANIENATFHTLRHTYTTRCLENGIDIVTVSKMLGHANTRLTADTYSHLLAEHQAAETQKIKGTYISPDETK